MLVKPKNPQSKYKPIIDHFNKQSIKNMTNKIEFKSITKGNTYVYLDEIMVEMVSALGQILGSLIMPKKMEEGITKAYFESGTIRSIYMYINGKEVTDNKNYNPYNSQL